MKPCQYCVVNACKYEILHFCPFKKTPVKVSVERLTAVHREAMLNNLGGIEPVPPPTPPSVFINCVRVSDARVQS